MLTHGISLRHWQRIEAGKSITVTTLLKIADAFNVPPSDLIADLYRKRKVRG
jgi:transcriptional regulator with XRE-family HTH domain